MKLRLAVVKNNLLLPLKCFNHIIKNQTLTLIYIVVKI